MGSLPWRFRKAAYATMNFWAYMAHGKKNH